MRARRAHTVGAVDPQQSAGCPVHGVAQEFRPFDIADPFALYARARAEEPFFSAKIGFRVVTRYEDVHAILRVPS